jgi:hypothetical protein
MTADRVKGRQELFLEQFVQQAMKEAQATEGLTPEQRTERQDSIEAQANQRRRALWAHWFRVNSWTVHQAACLVLGRDPDNPFRGVDRHSNAARGELKTATARLEALADERLKPKSRPRIRPRRYAPHALIELMAGEGWGLAADLAALANQMNLTVSTGRKAATASDAPRKRSRVERRAELVVSVARQILGIAPDDARMLLELTYNTDEFEKVLHQHCPPADRVLLSCNRDTLKLARLDRTQRPDLPKVVLRSGAPPGK